MKRALVVFLSFSTLSIANSNVNISVNSYQEITKKDKNGKLIKSWVKPTKVIPGSTIKYVDTITNDSNKTIINVKVKNPIDNNLIYIKDSVKSKAKISVKFSVDGGKSFSEANKLYIKTKDGKKALATPKDYNAILINIAEVPAKSKVEVEYKVKVK